MFGKALVALLVVAFVWLAIRGRKRGGRPGGPALRGPLVPAGALRFLAYGLVSVMVAGSALYFYQSWDQGREIVRVRIVNAHTGQGVTYSVRREDLAGRSFRTLEGHRIVLADVERMEVDSGQQAGEVFQPFGSDPH
jgi:hypothetical protein